MYHSVQLQNNILYGQFLRLCCNSIALLDFHHGSTRLTRQFLARGCPPQIISKAKKNAVRIDGKSLFSTKISQKANLIHCSIINMPMLSADSLNVISIQLVISQAVLCHLWLALKPPVVIGIFFSQGRYFCCAQFQSMSGTLQAQVLQSLLLLSSATGFSPSGLKGTTYITGIY